MSGNSLGQIFKVIVRNTNQKSEDYDALKDCYGRPLSPEVCVRFFSSLR